MSAQPQTLPIRTDRSTVPQKMNCRMLIEFSSLFVHVFRVVRMGADDKVCSTSIRIRDGVSKQGRLLCLWRTCESPRSPHLHRYAIPYLSPRNPRRLRGSALASSCHVRTLQRTRSSTGRTHFITAYHASISSGLLASVSRQNAQLAT